MRIKLRKESENPHSIIGYWEPGIILYAGGGDGGGGGSGDLGDSSGGTDFGGSPYGGADPGPTGGEAGNGGGQIDTAGGGGGGYTPPVEPTAPTPSPLQPFLDALAQYNPQFMNAGYTGMGQGTLDATNLANTNIANQLAGIINPAQQQTANIAQTLQNIGTGQADPRFEAYAKSQLGLMETQRQGELGRASENLSRRGLGGSSAELNAGTAINNQYNQQQQNLASQLGLQSLGRQDTALQNALGAYGQSANLGLAGAQAQSGLNQQNFGNTLQQIQSQNAARGSNLEALTAGLQNLTLPYALETARTAAENAGESGDGGKK